MKIQFYYNNFIKTINQYYKFKKIILKTKILLKIIINIKII